MRELWVALVVAGCGSQNATTPAPAIPPVAQLAPATRPADAGDAPATADGAAQLPAHQAFADLGASFAAIIPADARVIGFGELHSRVDRAPVRSALAAFTQALPAVADKVSDLVVKTWIVDPSCGKHAASATKAVETSVKRPEATKSEIAQLADAARAAGIQPHAMTLSCDDYRQIAPASGQPDPVAMLTITTRELKRIAISAVVHRDRTPDHRPWIAVYGGALHNDRFPDPTVAEWSYAADVDRATRDHFVEIDLVVPELAIADDRSHHEPWFALAEAAGDHVAVWTRGERSFVVILPRAR